MHAPSYIRSRSGSRDGIALVMVLAFIVLLTILIVSFIAFTKLNRVSTASYSKAIQAQEIAQGGLQDILQDVHTEIVAGSSNYVVGTGSYASAYIPKTNVTAAPAHLGYAPVVWGNDVNSPNQDNLAPTLLRVSRASQDTTHPNYFYPSVFTNTAYYDGVLAANLINRASASNTSTPSANGRSISAARWNNTFLLACSSTTNTGDDPYYLPGVFVSTNYLSDPNYSGSTLPSFTGPSGPPDWVYVTRSGSRVCNAATEMASLLPSANVSASYTVTPGSNPPAAPIVGRYAYVMYDEGGTLDVNAAGFYSSTPVAQAYAATNAANVYAVTNSAYPNATQNVMGKSFIADADLSVLLGPQTAVNNLIAWRNASIATLNNVNYLNAAFNYAQKGFLSFQSGDSPMVSRQDLIHYFAKVDPTFDTDTPSPGLSRALPYLGIFSRAVSAPSWAPTADSSSMPGYKVGWSSPVLYRTNMENTGVANRDMANIRYPVSTPANTSITHYFDDVTVTPGTYTVNPGDPLLRDRFSLAKIAWLSQVSPNPADGKATVPSAYQNPIQACFGLYWETQGSANGGNACWTYTGSTTIGSTTAVGSIETLDVVASEHREPNFFELLKAAILSGSLGVQPGQAGWQNVTIPPTMFRDAGIYNNFPGPEVLDAYSFDRTYFGATLPATFPPSSIPAPAVVPDVQIMKIGANIIDQFDSDSYPTAIYFNYFANTANTTNANATNYDAATSGPAGIDHTRYGEANMVFGDENLPYLQSVYMISGTVTNTGSPEGMNGWLQPQLWNPHQVPASFPAATPQLTQYQIRAYGQADVSWNKEYTPPGSEAQSGMTFIPAPGLLDGSYINFTLDATGNQQIAAGPLSTVTAVGNPHFVSTPAGVNSANMSANPNMEDYAGNPFVGFWIGTDLPSGPTAEYVLDPDALALAEGQLPRCYSRLDTTGAYSLALGWTDSAGGFHPYSFMTQMAGYAYGVVGNEKNGYSVDIAAGNTLSGSAIPCSTGDDCHFTVDPRTFRFGSYGDWGGVDSARPAPYCGATTTPATTFYPAAVAAGSKPTSNSNWGLPTSSNFTFAAGPFGSFYIGDWEINSAAPQASTNGSATYYCDNDGVVRPADGVYGDAQTTAPSNTGDGMQSFISNGTPTASGGVTLAAGDSGGNAQNGRRPIVLNRPFHNVGELGYAFRDLPFKTLDFFTQYSADAALLDVFSVTDEAQISSNNQISAVVSGKVNPNNAPSPVLQAILSYGSKKDLDSTYNMITTKDALSQAQHISTQLSSATGTGPIKSRADLVTQLAPVLISGYSGTTSADRSDKAYLEGPIRALSNITNARTWNLMIDIIAQSGHLSPTATTLDNFVVEGEKRYWLHIAIDRYTGKIVDQQLEPVYE